LTPDFEQVLTTEASAALDARREPLFARDASNGDIVILEPRKNSSGSTSDTAVVSAFSENAGQYQRRYSQTLDPGTITFSLGTAAGRTIVLASDRLSSIDRDGNRQAINLKDGASLAVESILYLDAKKLVLGVAWKAPTSSEGVVVLSVDDFSELGRYLTSEHPTSFAQVGGHWVIGSKSSVSVATPACSGN
jgi:hypothetical protein